MNCDNKRHNINTKNGKENKKGDLWWDVEISEGEKVAWK